jgi:hypothetical protein
MGECRQLGNCDMAMSAVCRTCTPLPLLDNDPLGLAQEQAESVSLEAY